MENVTIPNLGCERRNERKNTYHIDTIVIGDDWKGKFDFLKDEGVEIVYLPRTPEISSSQMKRDLHNANDVGSESKLIHDDIETDPKEEPIQ